MSVFKSILDYCDGMVFFFFVWSIYFIKEFDYFVFDICEVYLFVEFEFKRN